MATVNDYKAALVKAQDAGDEEAVQHFQSQIEIGLNSVKGPAGAEKPIPQGGNILDAALGGIPFSDELAGTGGGIASAIMGLTGLQEDKGLSGNFSRGYDLITKDMRKRKGEYRERNPVTSMAAEIGTGLATAGPLGLLRGGLPAAVGTGALYGAGEGDGDLVDRAKSAVTGGATGGVLHTGGKALSSLGRVLFPAVSSKAALPGFRESLRTLRTNEIPVTAAEQIGSKTGRLAERATGQYFNQANSVEARPQALFGRLMRSSGFDPADVRVGELSEEAVNRASQRFNRRYDNVLRGVTVQLPDMDPWMRRIEAGVAQLLPHEVMGAAQTAQRIIRSFRDEIGQNRNISGTDYKRIRSDLGKRAKAAQKNPIGNWVAPVYRALQANLDDAFRQAVPSAQRNALRAVDQDYAGYKILQEAQRSAGGADAIGTMANRMRTGRSRPRREFRELLQAYQDVILRGGAQTSGTAENTQTIGRLIPPIPSMLRATGAKASAGAARLGLDNPLPAGSGAFIAGQQAPNSAIEDLVRALGELR